MPPPAHTLAKRDTGTTTLIVAIVVSLVLVAALTLGGLWIYTRWTVSLTLASPSSGH